MNSGVQTIPLTNLALAFIPVAIVILIMLRWSLDAAGGLFAVARMLLQLALIGYLLNWIFSAESSFIVAGVLSIMLMAASWIAIRPLGQHSWRNFGRALLAILTAGCLTLALITALVLETDPWYAPRQVIPLAGMIFASAMNTVSLAAERLEAEYSRGTPPSEARRLAYQACLIPLLNSLLAVGLVSLPGMMTGQILSGVSPLIAVRYQIMVMCMLTGAAGIAAALYLTLAQRHKIAS
jgi:putative ABC transport system permease protein